MQRLSMLWYYMTVCKFYIGMFILDSFEDLLIFWEGEETQDVLFLRRGVAHD